MSSPADELLGPVAVRVSLALGGGLGAIVAVERHHLRELTSRVLFVRWRTWLLTAPIFGLAVTVSRWTTVLLAAAIGAQAVREFARMTGLPRGLTASMIAIALVSPVVCALSPAAWLALPSAFVIVVSVVPVARGDAGRGSRVLADATFGIVWMVMGIGSLVALREAFGPGLVLAVGTAVAIADVTAFVAGKALGRTPLAPAISPAKTVEGALGAIAGATAGFWLLAFAAPALPPVARVSLPVAIGVAAVAGDLLESLVKRRAGVKDAGAWLPGFGGILDRVDSLLFVLPVSYAVAAVAR